MKRSAESLLKRYRVTEGAGFRLADHDPSDARRHAIGHDEADGLLADGIERLAALQTRLYADGRRSLLVILQAMDAAGKDGTIKHVLTGVNPQGVRVTSFKVPGQEELAHDYLWRIHANAPRRGEIGIFNRSQYEEVLTCRVHPELLDGQKLPDQKIGRKFWQQRLADIAGFEAYLVRQGTSVIKVFLHLSKAEQKQRFLARLATPEKNWKFSSADLTERGFWDDYQAAYEAAIAATASRQAPWYVVPADDKRFAHVIVVAALIHGLEQMELGLPIITDEARDRLARARTALEAE